MRTRGGGADGERHCPARRPELVSTVPLPDAWYESYLPPTVSGGLLLAAAGAACDAVAVTVPALIALDARSAVERFRVRVPLGWRGAEGGCQVGVPRPLPDARILLPVYQWDESFTVYLIDADGRILRADDLADGRESALDVYGADVSVKLWQEPLAVGTGAYLASWVYRAYSWHLQCRDLATGALRWEAAERALAAAGDLAVTETAPGQDNGGEIVGRAMAASGGGCRRARSSRGGPPRSARWSVTRRCWWTAGAGSPRKRPARRRSSRARRSSTWSPSSTTWLEPGNGSIRRRGRS